MRQNKVGRRNKKGEELAVGVSSKKAREFRFCVRKRWNGKVYERKKRNIRVKEGIDKVPGAEQGPLMPNLLSATFFTFSPGLEAKKRPIFLASTFC